MTASQAQVLLEQPVNHLDPLAGLPGPQQRANRDVTIKRAEQEKARPLPVQLAPHDQDIEPTDLTGDRQAADAPPELRVQVIRTPIEWAAKPVQSERMRLVELPRREGEKRVPDVEPAIQRSSGLLAKQTESV
jgi:hypothetical protein